MEIREAGKSNYLNINIIVWKIHLPIGIKTPPRRTYNFLISILNLDKNVRLHVIFLFLLNHFHTAHVLFLVCSFQIFKMNCESSLKSKHIPRILHRHFVAVARFEKRWIFCYVQLNNSTSFICKQLWQRILSKFCNTKKFSNKRMLFVALCFTQWEERVQFPCCMFLLCCQSFPALCCYLLSRWNV